MIFKEYNVYMIESYELLNLIEQSEKYKALIKGGVDNWEWFKQSLEDHLKDNNKEYYWQLAEDIIDEKTLGNTILGTIKVQED